ncbi:MAG: hypothetical protein Q9159_006468 [Coniocarpon cinnabarinum]
MMPGTAFEARFALGFRYQHRMLLQKKSAFSLLRPTSRILGRAQTTTAYASQPSRPLSSRTFRTVSLYTFITSSAFLTGAYLALSYLPNRDALMALFTATPPSNAETLSMYTPPNSAASLTNDKILSSPLALSLRASGGYTEARPHLKIPDALKPTNLTGGTLAGPGRITVPPLMFNDGGKNLTTLLHLGPQLCGHPSIIHGGLLATLLDEGLARCCFPALPGKIGVTARLTVDYKKPVRADRFYAIRAETTKVEGRKAWAKGWIEEIDVEGQQATRGEDGAPVKICEAEGLFVSPKNAELLTKVYRYSGAT